VPLGIAALLATATFGLGALATTPAQAAAATPVSVWETTTNQSQLLAAQTGTSFASGVSTQGTDIAINPATTYQTMTGFGASFTGSSASLVYDSPLRNQIMTQLFSPTQGDGLSFLRQPIGSTDFSLSTYSYDDPPSGGTDPTLADFSIAQDESYIIPILQQALALNPGITVMGTPWSPPAWMKSTGTMDGGTLNSSDYQAFANYLVKFIQAYDAAGVPISLISPQNEPENSTTAYPSSTFTSTQEADFIANNLGPAMKSAGLSTGILDYDHNWDDPSFPETVLGDSAAAQYVVGTAWHCYAGDVSAQSTVEALYPNYGTYETECSGTEASPASATFADTLDWDMSNLVIGATRNYAKTAVTWNIALNPSFGPSLNCTDCTALVTVNNTADTATYNAEYYALGQASRFVKPGAVRIGSNSYSSGIQDVAFQNTGGSTALIAENSASSAQTFGVTENGQNFSYTLPAGAVATFTWPALPASSSNINSSAWYEVKNAGSGLCVQPTGGATANGTVLDQEPCTGATDQLWQFQPEGGGYQVANESAPGEVWDVTGGTGATSNGTAIQIWSATGGTNQQWQALPVANGDYEFAAQNSGTECLDVTGESTASGTQLQQWACSGTDAAQTFQLVQSGTTSSPSASPSTSPSASPSASPTGSSGGGGINTADWYEVKNTGSGLCVEAENSGTTNGTPVDQHTCTGAANQLWQFQTDGSGYQVANQNASGEVWDVTGGTGATSNGTPIQVWSAGGGSNQEWVPTLLSDGDYEFAAHNSGTECLDVTNESTASGTQLQQWTCSATDAAQSFALSTVS
jgi:glucosylceramidase